MECECGYKGPGTHDKFKDVLHGNLENGDDVYFTVHIQFCPKCGKVEDRGTWVEK